MISREPTTRPSTTRAIAHRAAERCSVCASRSEHVAGGYLPSMALLATDAIVLHAFDYLESSRILRLVTREGGVRSVLAKGARRSSRRFGGGLDLFAQGTAHLYTKPGRDLDTLAGFDIARSRPALGEDLGRFTGASAVAELTLRFGGEAADGGLIDAVSNAVDARAVASAGSASTGTLPSARGVVAQIGFAPAPATRGDGTRPICPAATPLI